MKKILLFFILLILISGCKQSCESKLYTKDGKCCTYICDKICTNGYAEGTCNCECLTLEGNAGGDTNIDSIFDDKGGIEPPQVPS